MGIGQNGFSDIGFDKYQCNELFQKQTLIAPTEQNEIHLIDIYMYLPIRHRSKIFYRSM